MFDEMAVRGGRKVSYTVRCGGAEAAAIGFGWYGTAYRVGGVASGADAGDKEFHVSGVGCRVSEMGFTVCSEVGGLWL